MMCDNGLLFWAGLYVNFSRQEFRNNSGCTCCTVRLGVDGKWV